MIFLFSDKDGALRDGAAFMQTKNLQLHPGLPGFYRIQQAGSLHSCVNNLGPNSVFTQQNCKLSQGEAAIIIGHGGDDPNLYDEKRQNVTAAAFRLLTKLTADNANTPFTVFVAACGGGVRQPGQQTSLLTTLIKGTDALATRLSQKTISAWSYTASAGLATFDNSVLPDNCVGTHIYGVLTDNHQVEQHCGYDRRITVQLTRTLDGTYLTVFFAPALYPLSEVVAWWNDRPRTPMQDRFPKLFATVEQTA